MLRRILDKLVKPYRGIIQYARILNAHSIARRMFVTNSFDGLLSGLGVVLGSYLSGASNPVNYVGSVIGASFSMGFFSGVVATYLSERAERLQELRKTERAMLHPLRGSIYERAAKIVPIYVALWSGLGAMLLPVIGVSPFIFAEILKADVSVTVLVYTSAGIMVAELFTLGAYLGKISGENKFVSGARLALIGLAAVLFFTLASVIM